MMRDKSTINFIENKIRTIPNSFWFSMIATLIFAIMSHAMGFFNIYPGHDSCGVYYLYENSLLDNILMGASSGRFFGGVSNVLSYMLCMPWMSGMWFIVLYGISTWLISQALDIESKVCIILIAGLIVTNPTAISVNAYCGWTYSSSISLFLASASIYAFFKTKKRYAWCLLLTFLTVSTYGAYISLIVATFLVIAIANILINRDNDIKKVLCDHFAMLLIAVVSAISSWAISIGLSNRFYSDGTQGRVTGVMATISTGIILRLKYCLNGIINVFKSDINSSVIYKGAFLIGIVTLFVLSVTLFLKNKIYKNILIAMVMVIDIICLPFAMDCISIVWTSHSLMWFGYIAPYFLVVYMLEQINRESILSVFRDCRFLAICSLFFLLFISVTTYHWIDLANAAYTKMWANYEAGINLANRVVDRVESIEGYEKGNTKVLFVGNIKTGYRRTDGAFYMLDWITAGVGEYYDTAFTYMRPFYVFIEQELCIDMRIINESSIDMSIENVKRDLENNGIESSDELMQDINAMDCYPAIDSYLWVDDVLIVKVGE